MATMVIRALSVGQKNQTETTAATLQIMQRFPPGPQNAVELAVKAGNPQRLARQCLWPFAKCHPGRDAVILTRMSG
jgi:hypothetical protein